MTAIGDTLWTHGYGENPDHNPERIRLKHTIVGETRQSWLLDNRKNPYKVSKRYLSERIPGHGWRQWYTEQEKVDFAFVRKHAWAVARGVQQVRSAEALKKIAELVGVELIDDA